MRSQWKDMDPVDDFVTQQTPGLKIYQKVWGGMQCAYHSLPRALTSRRCWRQCRNICASFRITPTSSAAR